MRNIFLCGLSLMVFQGLQAQIEIYSGEGLKRHKIGYYDNHSVFSSRDQRADERIGSTQVSPDGRLQLLAADGSILGYMVWNNDPAGASSVFSKTGKQIGFVSAATGNPVLYTVTAGKAQVVGFANAGLLKPDAPDYQLAAAAAAFLLFFDWC